MRGQQGVTESANVFFFRQGALARLLRCSPSPLSRSFARPRLRSRCAFHKKTGKKIIRATFFFQSFRLDPSLSLSRARALAACVTRTFSPGSTASTHKS
jgi:hypothetical protein